MSRKANPKAIGAFVLGALVLLVAAIVYLRRRRPGVLGLLFSH